MSTLTPARSFHPETLFWWTRTEWQHETSTPRPAQWCWPDPARGHHKTAGSHQYQSYSRPEDLSRQKKLLFTLFTNKYLIWVEMLTVRYPTCLCNDCRVAPAFSGLLTFSWIPYNRDLDSESSCRSQLLVSSHSVWGSTQLSSPQPVWRTWTAVPCPSAKTSAYAVYVQDRDCQTQVRSDQGGQTTTRKHRTKHRQKHTATHKHLQAFRQQ